MRIHRRDFVKIAGAGVCLTGISSLSALAASNDRPNIVLCMADDQGWGDVGCYGHPILKTPHFDDMAATGLRFDRFYAAAPVCSPTRGSVLTGRHPNRFGCFQWGFPLRPQETTIAEVLRKAGYVTGHFGKWHLGSVCKNSPVNPGAKGFDEWFSAPNFFDNDPIMSRAGIAVPTPGESSMITVDAALAFIRKHAASRRPFLAVVWFGNPHAPHEALEEDRALYPGQSEKRQNYYGEITAMDRAFGRLRQELRTLGIRENTVLWYCSDNGGLPGVGVTGGRGNKGQIYEGGLRVPALLEWPARVAQSRITNVPCNTCDIYPTLLEIAGIKADAGHPLDGISLVPLLDGRMESRPKPMGFWNHPTPGIATPSKQWMASLYEAQKAGKEVDDPARQMLDAGTIARQYPQDSFPGHAAWLDWPWKLHRIEKKGPPKFELYHLADDSQESRDLAGRHPDRTESLRRQLEAWLLSVVRSLNGNDY
jgi:arylsulfatase A-like enzyme